jgi:hypothetical protein
MDISDSEIDWQDSILKDCKELLLESELKWRDFSKKTQKQRNKDLAAKQVKESHKVKKTWKTQTEGIEASELQRRKAAGKCQQCPWPRDRKGNHTMIDCFRWKRLDEGTVPFPKARHIKGD